MAGGLIFALSLAGFLLLLFGERLGMPSEMGKSITLLIFTLMVMGLAFASVASRLAGILTADGRAARIALTVIAGASLVMLDPATGGSRGSVLLMFGAFWLVLLVVPDPETPIMKAEQSECRSDLELRWVLAGCTGLGAGVLLLRLWPEAILIWHPLVGADHAFNLKLALVLLALPVVLGGMGALSRLARTLLMLALVLVLLPALLTGLGETLALLREGPEAALAASRHVLSQLAISAMPAKMLWHQPMPVLIGMATGLVVRTAWMPMQSLPLRLGHAALAMLGLMAIVLGAAMVLPPFSLPLAGQISQLSAALVKAQGWPLIVGFVWAGLALGAAMTMIALALYALATALSEHLAYRLLRPKGLKAWRLVMARILVLLLIAALFWQAETGWRLDSAFTQFALLGCALLLILTLFIRVMRVMRAFWRARRVSPPAALVLADA